MNGEAEGCNSCQASESEGQWVRERALITQLVERCVRCAGRDTGVRAYVCMFLYVRACVCTCVCVCECPVCTYVKNVLCVSTTMQSVHRPSLSDEVVGVECQFLTGLH